MTDSQSSPIRYKEALDLLGLDPSYDETSLKSAFKAIVHKCHPDKDGGSHEAFIKATNAFNLLKSFLRPRKAQDVGEDIHIDLSTDWNSFLHGSKIILNLKTSKQTSTCGDCNGSGKKPTTRLSKCVYCMGRGFNLERSLGADVKQICVECAGSGKIRIGTCNRCNGSGEAHLEWSLEIDLPSGLFPGNLLKFKGKGAPGSIPGDLTLLISVKPPSGIELTHDSIIKTVEIDFASVACGGNYKFIGLYGEPLEVRIPPPMQEPRVILPEHGVILPNKRKSPLVILIRPTIPLNISRRALLLLNELKAEWNPLG